MLTHIDLVDQVTREEFVECMLESEPLARLEKADSDPDPDPDPDSDSDPNLNLNPDLRPPDLRLTLTYFP